MSGHRVVGWLECVACADPPAFQHHQSRDPRNMEIPVSTGRNLYLSVGNRISICTMHVGIGITMGMYLFAFVMIVLNVAAFGPRLGRMECRTTNLQPQKAVS